MADGETKFSVPGSHVYEGVTYGSAVPAVNLDRVKNFEYKDDDVILVTYPKSGTHWMKTIIESIAKIRAGESTVESGSPSRTPFIEFNLPPEMTVSAMDVIEKKPSPRFYMSHLMANFFSGPLSNQKTKFIVVMRNIKDTLVSYYHFYRSNKGLGQFQGSFADFMELVKERTLVYGDWFDYTLGWWQYKDHPNCSFFMYEDMKRDINKEIRRVGEILGVPLTPDDVTKIREASSFDAMKKVMDKPPTAGGFQPPTDTKISPFMRKGTVGDWTNYFTPEISAYLDEVYEKRMSGLADKPNFATSLS